MENCMFDFTYYGKTYYVDYNIVINHVLESYPYFEHMMIYNIDTGKFVNPRTVYENYLHGKYQWYFELCKRHLTYGTGTGKVRCTKRGTGFSFRGKGLFSDMAFSQTREAVHEYKEPCIRNVHIPGYYDWYDVTGLCNRSRDWKRTKVRKQYMKHTKHSKTKLPTKLDWDFDE